jgi:hypothetical protein
MAEGGFLGELASVAAMDSPGLLSARGTGCMRGRGSDPEGQCGAIEFGPDQATADGSTQELGEEQARLPTDEEWERTRRGDNLSTFFDHQKCGRAPLTRSFPTQQENINSYKHNIFHFDPASTAFPGSASIIKNDLQDIFSVNLLSILISFHAQIKSSYTPIKIIQIQNPRCS